MIIEACKDNILWLQSYDEVFVDHVMWAVIISVFWHFGCDDMLPMYHEIRISSSD